LRDNEKLLLLIVPKIFPKNLYTPNTSVYLGINLPTKNKSLPIHEEKGILVCERCGRPIDWISRKKRGNRVYLYAVHYLGKGKREECYLGPADGYIHAETINPLGLTNAYNQERYVEYVRRIIDNYLANDHFDVKKGLEILDLVLDLLDVKANSQEDRKVIADRLKAWAERIAPK